ncbi:MAG: virulence RhuM family protein [Coriobacteriales bacterium]|jgi:hypothetical protein|nr:virulence RhuM family protein [Coriobacteriales bacterium]
MDKGEIILYRPQDDAVAIDVLVESETVWLTQAQMVELFGKTKQNISLHVNNIIKDGELQANRTVKDSLTVQIEGNREVQRKVTYYNLDMIISVGYRVKSQRGIEFRIWATQVLKEYFMHGYAVNRRIERLEHRMTETEKKVDFFVKTALPPVEGIFYGGQIFDAYTFASDRIREAKERIVLLDNYANDRVLTLLSKRDAKASAEIYTKEISKQLQQDLAKHNAQYAPITIKTTSKIHDRFLIIDNTVYHIGASLKDLGKKLFAFSKMEVKPAELLKNI